MKISYVIPVYNKNAETIGLTSRAIDSIKQCAKAGEYEIILIDNASPAHKNEADRNIIYNNSNVKIIVLPENIGFGAACNLGFRLAQGKYICCMNSDSALVEDSANILIEFMEKHNIQVGMPEHFENCLHYNLGKSDEIMWKWFFGAFWVSKRSFIYETMHGFDEVNFPMCYFEDTDLWSRCIAAGHKVAGYRGTWVMHKGNASAVNNMHEIFAKNRETYIAKWGTDKVTGYAHGKY